MSADQHVWTYLARKPGSHYKQLFVKGTRIAAWVLYNYHTPGQDWPGETVEQLANDFNLPIEAVREAIAYCQSSPPELSEDWERQESLEAAMHNGHGSRRLSPEEYARIFRP
jgi:uncharacterized protein (DUF433 family)